MLWSVLLFIIRRGCAENALGVCEAQIGGVCIPSTVQLLLYWILNNVLGYRTINREICRLATGECAEMDSIVITDQLHTLWRSLPVMTCPKVWDSKRVSINIKSHKLRFHVYVQRIYWCSVEALQSKSSYTIEARMLRQHRTSAQDTTLNLVVKR